MLAQPHPFSSAASINSNPLSGPGGTTSKHAQRIAAATMAAKQASASAAAQAQSVPDHLPKTQWGGSASQLVELDPQWQNDNSRPRTAPSLASGGVPDPSTQYLAQTLSPSVPLATPRRILVIIDLNGTLLYRPSRRRPFDFVLRPHACDFLSYCLDTFYVAIWSSARPDNVRKMVAQLLTPEQINRCVIVWARDRFGLDAQDYDARVQCYKRLTRVWADPSIQASCPADMGKWDQSNTVLVDDSLEKGRSEPYNILPLPEFSGIENETAEVLPQVHDYLNTLCGQSDISSYMRRNQFQLNPSYVLPP
ncbi:hypothetical protein NLU13_1735 [Sarocladium strictum]|uniref:Mitochondrial import inner membrane translocase subunit TIM50 n=1 Tax=Sarocladium strictum TaxID=5046 RepID=A0AA39LCH9_SARSR|nr:hypothetical protein NLU13_1735 [Sarocladium strictum]